MKEVDISTLLPGSNRAPHQAKLSPCADISRDFDNPLRSGICVTDEFDEGCSAEYMLVFLNKDTFANRPLVEELSTMFVHNWLEIILVYEQHMRSRGSCLFKLLADSQALATCGTMVR